MSGNTINQQDFLRQAMQELGELHGFARAITREEMCERLGCPVKTFDKWMLASSNGREMPSTMWNHVREILQHDRLKFRVTNKEES
ncbi:hypothetical protein [Aquabacterium sp. CECT 9606]|uniref:hypothetical protein n=1 Tax=Aquabacterium sp. CECT 9606 TaxID=2845822 RepID=UPI001E2E043F|nr:hypothetical protein [Aquabacterium sp. CECT 9606]